MDIDQLPERYQKQVLSKVGKDVHAKQPKRSKYGNVKTEVDGRVFDSKAEARRYKELKLMQQAGEIRGFICQVSIPLYTSRYIADFLVYGNSGELWLEDVKGHVTAVFRIKQKEVEKLYPWIPLRIIKR